MTDQEITRAGTRAVDAEQLDACLIEVSMAYRRFASYTPGASLAFRRALSWHQLPGGYCDKDKNVAASMVMQFPVSAANLAAIDALAAAVAADHYRRALS